MTITFDRGTLLLQADDVRPFKEAVGEENLVFDERVGAFRCDAIHYAALCGTELPAGYKLVDEAARWRNIYWQRLDLPELRKEQQEAYEAWQKVKRGVIVMPTGTGKTEVALAIMRDLGVSTLVVSPVRDLMYQWHRRIYQGLGFDAGIIGDNIFDLKPVSVTTYDSAFIHMERLGNMFALIVFDECHHLPGQVRREAALLCAAPYRMGLSATPQRADGLEKDLALLIGPIVYDLPLSSMRGKSLADYQVVRIPVHLRPEEQQVYDRSAKIVRGYMVKRRQEEQSFSWHDLLAETGKEPEAREAQKAFYTMQSIQDRAAEKLRVLEDIFRLHLGTPVIVFTGSNVVARDVSKRFLIPCLLNHCGKQERLDILDGFKDGSYPALVANQVLDEGVDIPEAKVGVVLGGHASTRQAIQRLGRILRKSGSKQGILYEVVCEETREVLRSRRRRRSDAYQGTRHRRI